MRWYKPVLVRKAGQESMITGNNTVAFLRELIRRIRNLMEAHPEAEYEAIARCMIISAPPFQILFGTRR